MEAYRRGDRIIHHLSGDFAEKHVQFVLPDGVNSARIAVKIGDATIRERHRPAPKLLEQPELPPIDPPDAFRTAIDTLLSQLERVDAAVEQGAIVHDYHNGTDRRVPLLVKGYLGGPGRFATAVLFACGDHDSDPESAKAARKLLEGSRLAASSSFRTSRSQTRLKASL